MTEADSESEQKLEASLLDVRNSTAFADFDLRANFEHVTRLSRLFLQILAKSGLSSVQSLNVIIPGASFREIIGVLIAARAFGIRNTHVTSIEISDGDYNSERRTLGRIYGEKFAGTDKDATLNIGNDTIRLILGDAAKPKYKKISKNADATMVFIGNSPVSMGEVFDNWSTFPEMDILAATATNRPGEKNVIAEFFNHAKQKGGLTAIPQLDGVPNPNALSRTILNHSFIFAAVRK